MSEHTGKQRRRIGIFGGTFDPIHIGHLAAASEAMHKFDLDEVIFVPAVPSHKPDRTITAAEHRFAMVLLAVAANPKFSASRIDIDRGTLTYTSDTLADIRAELGAECDLWFITGADVIAELPGWERAEQLPEMAHFVGVTRCGHDLPAETHPGWSIHYCELPDIAISSTEIRRRVAADEPVWYWLPDSVLWYIGKHRLYGADWGYARR